MDMQTWAKANAKPAAIVFAVGLALGYAMGSSPAPTPRTDKAAPPEAANPADTQTAPGGWPALTPAQTEAFTQFAQTASPRLPISIVCNGTESKSCMRFAKSIVAIFDNAGWTIGATEKAFLTGQPGINMDQSTVGAPLSQVFTQQGFKVTSARNEDRSTIYIRIGKYQ